MAGVLTALIAVSGTLLGSLVGYVFQRKHTERAALLSLAEQLRREQLEVFSTFAGAAVRYRLSELDRWHRHDEHPASDAAQVARAANYQARASLIDILYRVQLIANDPDLPRLATDVINVTRTIHKAGTPEDREQRGIQARTAIEEFVRRARAEMQRSISSYPPQLDRSLETTGKRPKN